MKKYILFALLILSLVLVGCGGGDDTTDTTSPSEPAVEPTLAGDATTGQVTFTQSCSACHGPDAKGVEGLGKDLTTSEFVSSTSDADLLAFIKKGRPTSDPANSTGVDMPPKGGNPALTDDMIADIIAFIRSVNG